MAKRDTKAKALKRSIKDQIPPALRWVEYEDGWQPFILIANVFMPLEKRPFRGFYQNERNAILVAVKNVIGDFLFDVPPYLVNPKTGASAPNPDWDLLPFFVEQPDGSFLEVEGKPSLQQIAAAGNAAEHLRKKGL